MKWVLIGLGALVAVFAAVVLGGWAMLNRPDIPYEQLEARYGDPASAYVDLPNGVRAHYVDEGPRDGQPLLLIHGFSASSHTWRPWAERLSPRFRVIRLDLPGHGLTRSPEGFRPSTEAYADTVAAFVDALDLAPVVAVGSSMGGHVAQDFARRHGNRAAALVLVGAAGWPEPEPEQQEGGDMFALLRDPFWGPILMNLDSTNLTRQGLKASFVDKSLVTDEMVERYVTLSRAPGRRELLRALLTDRSLYTIATPELMAQITTPTLVLHGDKDALVPVEGGRRYAQTITGAQLIVYENIGHIPHEEIPDRTAEDLVAFIDGAVPSDPTRGIGQPLGVDPSGQGRPLTPAAGAAPGRPLEGVY